MTQKTRLPIIFHFDKNRYGHPHRSAGRSGQHSPIAERRQNTDFTGHFKAHKRIGKFESIVFASLDGLSINEAGAAINIVDRDYFKRVMEIKKALCL